MFKEFSVKRACIVRGRTDNEGKGFGFLEFNSIESAQTALLQLKALPSCTFHFSFGRDLRASALLLNSCSGGLAYWDHNCVLDCFPLAIDDKEPLVNGLLLSAPPKQRPTTNAIPILTKPAKKLELKRWSQKADQIPTVESLPAESKSIEIPKFLDFQSCTCHLCDDLQFASEGELKTHAQTSESHALKFTEYLARTEDAQVIRDRAAERRLAFAFDEDELLLKKDSNNNNKKDPIEPVDSVGARLLKKMGWREGRGLGRDESGITEPLSLRTAEQSGAGLGASLLISTEEYAAGRTARYVDKAKAGRKKRYNENE